MNVYFPGFLSFMPKLLLCLAVLCMGSMAGCAPKERQLTIVHTNDTHSYFAGTDPLHNACIESVESCLGGAARLSTVLQNAQKKQALILDAGDKFQGTLFYAALKSPAVAQVFANLPYDALTLGNHEFDDGCAALLPVLKASASPIVAANIVSGPDCPIAGTFTPYVIVHKQGLRIAIIGLAYEGTSTASSPCAHMTFGNALDALKASLAQVRQEKPDTIIVLSHNGYARDKEMAAQVRGVDCIVGGHSHTLLRQDPAAHPAAEGPYPTVIQDKDGKPVLVVTASYAMEYAGIVQLNYDKNNTMTGWSGDAVPLDNKIVAQSSMQNIVNNLSQQLQSYTRNIIGEQHITGIPDGTKLCRTADCLTGMIVADAFLEYGAPYGAQIGLVNGGGIRNILPQGSINQGDVLSIMPFGNAIVLVDIQGQDLLTSLSYALDKVEEGSGRFLQMAGLTVRFDRNKEKGKRLISAEYIDKNGKKQPVQPRASYRVATLEYLYKGGDGYSLWQKNPPLEMPTLLDVEVLSLYLKKHSPLTRLNSYPRAQEH